MMQFDCYNIFFMSIVIAVIILLLKIVEKLFKLKALAVFAFDIKFAAYLILAITIGTQIISKDFNVDIVTAFTFFVSVLESASNFASVADVHNRDE